MHFFKNHHQVREEEHDFSKGSVGGTILRLALPLIVAQFINVLYNIVDRIYIGRIPGASSAALTGVGVAFPVITAITAFSNLIGTGGPPLCSIARGRGDEERAEGIMGTSFTLTLITGVVLILVGMVIKDPLLYALGASDATFGYADDYISIYLLGTVFVMISLSMNGFINCQGFARTGMLTVLIGALINIVLDPVFIFVFGMGVKGAAIATVISQAVSAIWVVKFLTGKHTLLRIRLSRMKMNLGYVKEILALGLSGFIMAATNCGVQIVCNVTLQSFGGDAYVAVMTIVNSVREVLSVPVNGLTQGSQPVIGFNYGAGEYRRVKSGIKVMAAIGIVYTTLAWIITLLIPGVFIAMFNGREDRRAFHADLFLRILLYVSAVCGTECVYRAGKGETRHLLFSAEKSGDRDPSDPGAAPCGGIGGKRSFPGRADLQLYRRHCLLCHHALRNVAGFI